MEVFGRRYALVNAEMWGHSLFSGWLNYMFKPGTGC